MHMDLKTVYNESSWGIKWLNLMIPTAYVNKFCWNASRTCINSHLFKLFLMGLFFVVDYIQVPRYDKTIQTKKLAIKRNLFTRF